MSRKSLELYFLNKPITGFNTGEEEKEKFEDDIVWASASGYYDGLKELSQNDPPTTSEWLKKEF